MSVSQPVWIADDVFSFAVSDAEAAQRLATRLRTQGHWSEVVAGLESVCVQFDPGRLSSRQAIELIEQTLGSSTTELSEGEATSIEIPVRYGGEYGPDLADVCESLAISEPHFIELHTASVYTAEMIGFTPGFAYLGGLKKELSVPRLGTPRVRVPAGSIGISGIYSGLYAMPGPGGWPVIGRTEAVLFDAPKPDPFVIHPGQKVRFVAL